MIVVAGENLIDFIQIPRGDGTSGGNPVYEAAPGGSPYNCALAVASLGAPAGYLGVISDDVLGGLSRARLRASGARDLIETPSPAPSTLAVVNTDEAGRPAYRFYRAGTAERDISVERLTAALPEAPEILQTGSLCLGAEDDGAIWEAAAREAAGRGALVSIDPNVRPICVSDWDVYRARVSRLFELAAIVKISDEDLDSLGLDSDPTAVGDHLIGRHGCALVVVTRGTDGATLMTPHATCRVDSFVPPVVVDTVGAGDTFMAALLAGIHRRGLKTDAAVAALAAGELERMGRFAAVAAGLNCARKGCDPPTTDAVLAAMDHT